MRPGWSCGIPWPVDTEREADAMHHLVTGDDGLEQTLAGGIDGLGRGNGSGDDASRRVRDRFRDQIVQLKAMDRGAVAKRCRRADSDC